MLEGEINDMRTKYEALEDSQEFSRKLLEDMHTKEGTSESNQESQTKSIEMDELEE